MGSLAKHTFGGLSVGFFLGFAFFVVSFSGFSLGLGGCNNPSSPVSGTLERDGLGIAVSPDGHEVVVVGSQTRILEIIRSGRLTEQVTIASRGDATDVVLTPNGRDALVTDSDIGHSSGSLAIVDLSTGKVVRQVTVGSGPSGVAVSPDGSTAYVSDTGYINNGNVDVVDLATGSVVRTITVGQQPVGLAVSPDGKRLYVADATLYLPIPLPPLPEVPGNVEVVDTSTGKVVSSIQVGVAPLFLAESRDGGQIAVGDYGSNQVSLIDTVNNAVKSFLVPKGAFGVAYSPDGSTLYVTGGSSSLLDQAPGSEPINPARSDELSALEIASGTIRTSVKVAKDPTGVAVDNHGRIYVANGNFPSVAEMSPVDFDVTTIGLPGLGPLHRVQR